MCYYEAKCHGQKLVNYLKCQGHSEGLCNQNMTVFYYELGMVVQHLKLECPVQKWDYCVQDEDHSKSSKC